MELRPPFQRLQPGKPAGHRRRRPVLLLRRKLKRTTWRFRNRYPQDRSACSRRGVAAQLPLRTRYRCRLAAPIEYDRDLVFLDVVGWVEGFEPSATGTTIQRSTS